ncbi:MAG TPA: PadR family transcriptional regulator [Clostridiales bacterium]|nr:PadR family transcriptional regulator [Clostridiales bacterium]
MRTLKYAILGLVNRKSMTGYDISKEFGEELINFWSAKHSQIYPELKKLVDEGLLEYKIEITGDVLEKKVYTVTEKGRQDFLEWLAKDEKIEPTPKDQFRLRSYFSQALEPAIYQKLLESQLDQRKKKLAKLNRLFLQYQQVPPFGSDKFGDYSVLAGARIREEANIKWLELCLEAVRAEIKE